MCQDLWNRNSSQTLITEKNNVQDTRVRKSTCVSESGEEIRGCAPGVIAVFTPSTDLARRGGGLFWVVVLNMTTHRYLYLYPLNFSFLLLLLFCYPTEMQQLATEASCAHPLIGMLHPVRGSRGQTHTHQEWPDQSWKTGTWEKTRQVRWKDRGKVLIKENEPA